MALSKSTLKQNILDAFKKIKAGGDPGGPPPPLLSKKAADALADAYHKYATSAMAGALAPTAPGSAALISAALILTPLMAGWGPGLVAYWTPVVFAGAGFIPANPTVPAGASSCVGPIAALMAPPFGIKTEEEFADKLAGILHDATTKVQVTATTTAGVASSIPLA